MTPSQVLSALLPDRIFRLPQAGSPVYVTREQYLSGDVGQKLSIAQRWAQLNPDFAVNVTALISAQPKPLSPEQIQVSFGASFVPAAAYRAFVNHLLPSLTESWKVDISFAEATSTWTIDFRSRPTEAANTTTWGTPRCPATELIEAGLRLETPTVYDTGPDGERVKDSVATAAATAKLADIREEWQRWWRGSGFATPIAEAYAGRFNQHVPRRYDGSHLTFAELAARLPSDPSQPLIPRRHQLAGALRIVERGDLDDTVLLTYKVGLGKSLSAILGVKKRFDLGLSRKAVFVVPKHTLSQWRDFWRDYFPAFADRVLVADDGDFTVKTRQDFLATACLPTSSVVVLTYEQMATIPLRPDTFRAYIEREIDEVHADLLNNHTDTGSQSPLKRELKRRQARLEKLRAKYQEKWQKLSEKGTAPISWEDVGADVLVWDEVHYCKNDAITTRMSNVSGMPRSESQRAFDARMKSHWVAAPELFGELGVQAALKQYGSSKYHTNGYPPSGKLIGLTGTPITNTLAEVWVMMRLFQPRLLRDRGLHTFDAFAAVFTTPMPTVEMDAVGKFRQATRLRWQNLPELQMLLSQCWDRASNPPEIVRPDLATGRMQIVEVEGSPALRAYVAELAERAERVRAKEVDPSIDNMLKITHDGRIAGLFNGPPPGPDEPWPTHRTKVDAAAEVIAKLYTQSAHRRGVVLVFCDLFTPKADSDTDTDAMTDAERFRALGVYGVLRDKLIAQGVHAEEVAFVHDAETQAQRDKLFQRTRAGDIRVLIGSTQKLATGVNVQDRVYGMIHLTVPWRPDWLEQADGRGRRQGNKWATWGEGIHSVAVVTTGSYDVVSWQMIEQKATFISAIVNDEYEGRTADDIGDLVVTANVAKAIALGDMRVIEKTQLEVELTQHQRRYRLWREEKRRRADMARKLPGDIADLEARVGTLQAMVGQRDGHASGSSPSIVLLDNGRTIHPSTRDEANQRVFVLAERLRNRSRGEVELGTYRGLNLMLYFSGGRVEVVAQYPAVEQMPGYASVADIVVKVVADVFGAIDYQLGALDNEIAAWQQQAQQLRDRLAEVSGDMEPWQGETARAALARYEALCTELADGGPIDRKSFDLGSRPLDSTPSL